MTRSIDSKPEVGRPTVTQGGPAPGLSVAELEARLGGLSGTVTISFDGLLLVPFHVGVEPGGTVIIHVRSKHPLGGHG
jgi:hypothetical protein